LICENYLITTNPPSAKPPPMTPMRRFILLLIFALIVPNIIMSQCSVSLGNNISICQNATGTITAIPTGGTVSVYNWSNTTVANPFTIPTAVVATSTYTVTATFTNSCTASASVSVNVNAIPIAAISPASPTICNGQSTTLTASGGGTYAWSNLATSAATSASPVTTTTYRTKDKLPLNNLPV